MSPRPVRLVWYATAMHLPGSSSSTTTPSPPFEPSPKHSPWRALAHRNYALFFTGHGLSLCGTWMQSMALAWLVYRLSGSPFLLGLVELVSRAPILVFGIVGGLFADRWPRRQLMMIAEASLLVQATLLA